MTARPRSVWAGLLEASAPERRRFEVLVARTVRDLARSTACGAVCLGATSFPPQPPAALVAGWPSDERGE